MVPFPFHMAPMNGMPDTPETVCVTLFMWASIRVHTLSFHILSYPYLIQVWPLDVTNVHQPLVFSRPSPLINRGQDCLLRKCTGQMQ